jgi:periplasmic copper chaperone A
VNKPLSLAILLALMGPASAASLNITDAWFRALPGTLPAGGYFNVHNTGKNDLAILGAQSEGCSTVMVHKSSNAGGMSRMEHVDKVDVPAGGKVSFAPGGLHLMCMRPTSLMKIGGKVPVVLHLSDGTRVAATFAVRGASGK